MAQSAPSLDLLIFDTHNSLTMAIGDASIYPTGFAVATPTIEITPPSFPRVSIPFVASSVQVYNSFTLGLTSGEGCTNTPLPDGIYKVKYSIYPSYAYYTEKTFIRVERLLSQFDEAYLKLDLFECDAAVKYQERQSLALIEDYINGAIAAANKCSNKLAMELYEKANSLMIKFINGTCCLK